MTSLLLVEGKSEEIVIPEICDRCGVPINFEIKSENSIDELKAALKTHLKSTQKYRKLWLIIDADNNFNAAWQSIKGILLRSGKYNFKAKTPMPKEGFIVQPIDPEDMTVGVWIMPNNTDVGMLEDFMTSLIPDKDTLLECAGEVVQKLDSERDKHHKMFKRVHLSKAKLHTWLAWHDTPGESISVAVKKHLFATDKQLCQRFAAWLSLLLPEGNGDCVS